MNMVPVSSPKDFPTEPVFGFRGKSVEEIRKWAERRKAETVWYYRHKFGHEMYTAVTLVSQAAREIERRSADLLAEAGAR